MHKQTVKFYKQKSTKAKKVFQYMYTAEHS